MIHTWSFRESFKPLCLVISRNRVEESVDKITLRKKISHIYYTTVLKFWFSKSFFLKEIITFIKQGCIILIKSDSKDVLWKFFLLKCFFQDR